MTSLNFTLPPAQQRTPVIASAVLIVIAVVTAVIHVYYFTGLCGLCAVALLLSWFLVMRDSSSQLDERGIRSKRGVFSNEAAWAEVQDIRVDPRSGGVLIVHRREGKPFKLGAPVNAPLSRDPEYRVKTEQVLQFARAYVR